MDNVWQDGVDYIDGEIPGMITCINVKPWTWCMEIDDGGVDHIVGYSDEGKKVCLVCWL